ncbi:Os08g0460700, partial [Oryza sativa Japonica Group]
APPEAAASGGGGGRIAAGRTILAPPRRPRQHPLPPPHHIYEVVRTSALSRAWRRRWAALPSVDLARSPGISEPDVDAILLRRPAALRTFRLVARARKGTWSVDALHHWLLYLSRSGVQALDLSFPELRFRLHPCLFSCGEFTSLALNSCRLPPAPSGFAGFPNIKTLRLEDVDVPRHGGKEVAALIAASPLLEDLGLLAVKLIGDGPDEEWVIRAPNLRNLTMVCETAFGGRVEDLPRLDEGRLFGPNCAKFLAGMSQVTKLDFFCNCMLSTEVDVLERLPFLFKNLKNLSLAVNFF